MSGLVFACLWNVDAEEQVGSNKKREKDAEKRSHKSQPFKGKL